MAMIIPLTALFPPPPPPRGGEGDEEDQGEGESGTDSGSESGTDSTALAYGKQKRDSFIPSLGWQAQGQWGPVRPFAPAMWLKR